MDDRRDETIESLQKVADRLDRRGHAGHAGALRAVVAKRHRPGSVFLGALRETLQTVLTAVEAIDPVSATLVEELRLEVDKRLMEEHNSATER